MHGQVFIRKRKSGQIFAKRPDVGRNGLLLEIINSERSSTGIDQTSTNIPITRAVLSTTGDALVTADCHGNLVAFDLVRNIFKVIASTGTAVTALAFSLRRAGEFLSAHSDLTLRCYDSLSGALVATMRSCSAVDDTEADLTPVTSLSVHPSGRYTLAASRRSVYLWNVDTCELKRRLAVPQSRASLTAAFFIGQVDAVVTAFGDSTAWLWDAEGLTLRGELKAVRTASGAGSSASEDTKVESKGGRSKHRPGAKGGGFSKPLLSATTQDNLCTTVPTHYSTFAVSEDGCLLAAGGSDAACIRLWSLDATTAGCESIDSLMLPAKARRVRSLSFLPEACYPREELVVCVTADGVLRCLGTRSRSILFSIGAGPGEAGDTGIPSVGTVCRGPLHVSPSGNHLTTVTDGGTVRVYDLALMLKTFRIDAAAQKRAAAGKDSAATVQVRSHQHALRDSNQNAPIGEDDDRNQRLFVSAARAKALVPAKVPRMPLEDGPTSRRLDPSRLRAILSEYGEFPERYRLFIWRSVLKLPENAEAYGVLVEKGVHPLYSDLPSRYPIRSGKLARVLQRLLSALAFWSPALAQTEFIAPLAFPFAKLLQNNQLAAFETVASVLTGWCGPAWFEYAPHPPLTALAAVENLLSYHDRELFQHFVRYGVTTHDYAWALLQSAFSEVFTKSEWLCVWDHAFVSSPQFLLYLVVAFSVASRTELLDTFDSNVIRQFYRHQRGVGVTGTRSGATGTCDTGRMMTGVGAVIREANRIMDATPHDLRPSGMLAQPFKPLSAKSYPIVGQFPHKIKGFEKQEKERLQREEIEFVSGSTRGQHATLRA